MENKRGIIHLLPLLVVGILIIAVGGYILYFGLASAPDGQNSEKPLVQKGKEVVEKQTEIFEVDTENWKIYTNKMVGFSFKYPSDFTTDRGDDEYFAITNPIDEDRRVMAITNSDLKLEIIISENKEGFTLDEYVKDATTIVNGEVLSEYSTYIDRVETWVIDTDFMGKNREYYLIKGEYLIYMAKYPLNSKYDEIFDKILESFEFIEE